MRQGRRHELRVLPQTFDQGRADLLGQRMAFRQLQVVLGLGRLVAGRDLAVGPVGLLQRLADTGQFIGVKQAGDVKQHGGSTVGKCKGVNDIDSLLRFTSPIRRLRRFSLMKP
ncbi:hypothetical protein D3C85_1379340 [compost metagenome]